MLLDCATAEDEVEEALAEELLTATAEVGATTTLELVELDLAGTGATEVVLVD